MIWIPVTTALIVFSFSSGYFTHLKYQDRFDLKIFWKKKFQRLGVKLMVINCFLLLVFILQNKSGIWTWQTIINCIGMNGLLNWFHIPNVSPFGRGMWFFTLLVLFYAAYPALRTIRPQHWHVFMILFIALAYFCSRLHHPGHSLYLASVGFIAGVYSGGKRNIMISPFLSISLCVLTFLSMLAVNMVFNYNGLNFFFIFFFSILFIFSLFKLKIKDTVYQFISVISPCVLEIYLLHPYFSFRPTGYQALNFTCSLIIVLMLSMALNHFSKVLT